MAACRLASKFNKQRLMGTPNKLLIVKHDPCSHTELKCVQQLATARWPSRAELHIVVMGLTC